MTSASARCRDGSSPERAIVVADVADEYAWLRTRYPTFRLVLQRLIGHEGRMFDALMIDGGSDALLLVYFDVTAMIASRTEYRRIE